MSKDNHSRIPTRGFSRIPSAQITIPNIKPQAPAKDKLTRPSDIGPLTSYVRPSQSVTQKISQITKVSLSNLTSRIIPRSLASQSSFVAPKQLQDKQEFLLNCTIESSLPLSPQQNDDQMLIDETIDLIGSNDNVAMGFDGTITLNKDNASYNCGNATYELGKRDGTFIKSPSIGFDHTKLMNSSRERLMQQQRTFVGSVNSLLDKTKEQNIPENNHRAVSKSRDSLLVMGMARNRRSREEDLMGSMSLPKSPEWGSEDILNMSLDSSRNNLRDRTIVFNSTMLNNRLIDLTPARPFLNSTPNPMDQVNTTDILCMTNNESCTLVNENMEVDDTEPLTENSERSPPAVVMRNQDNRTITSNRQRFSFGLDRSDLTLDCSIELCDESVASSAVHHEKASPMEKQGSFEIDESLGILTPDQMKEFLDSTTTNHTNNAANLNLQLVPGHKLPLRYRIDQTPSPEELPLDPVGVKMEDAISNQQQQQQQHSVMPPTQEISETGSDPKTETMTKSATSKVSNSFITSITSITSLDTGYIGDGEMSRPASRGAADQSPSNGPKVPVNLNQNPGIQNWPPMPPPVAVHHRRQDPMTDSDFFTESDADDIFHRADQRRAQVIDGQLYGGPAMLPGAGVFIQQQPQMEDSCMESSGVFTDIENRGDDDLLHRLRENRENPQHIVSDMSPDTLSSDTLSSSNTAYSQKKLHSPNTYSSSHTHTSDFINLINVTSSSINTSICSSKNSDDVIDTINLISDASFGSNETTHEVNATPSTSAITKKQHLTAVGSVGKKLIANSRKQHKNEANYGLKKHEMSRAIVGKVKVGKVSPGKRLGEESCESRSQPTSAKKCLNGKWDAVMQKIGENKTVKKDFSVVKSKVTSGLLKRMESTISSRGSVIKTPPSNDHSLVSMDNGSVKRGSACGGTSSKRGRTFSKDSQQSSQSDLSFSGGSPKISSASKNSTVIIRSAKKRDVRTINSSPSDLGPPSKTSNGTNGTPRSSVRNISALQKRVTTPQQPANGIAASPATTPIPELKGSPTGKKIIPRRTTSAQSSPLAQNKLQPLKDHNRLVGQQQTPTATVTTNTSPKTGLSPRSSLRTNASIKIATSPPNALSLRNGTIILETSQIQPKSKGKDVENNNSVKVTNKNNANTNKIQQQQQQLLSQQLADQQALEKQKQMLEAKELLHANKSVEALGVLVQYLVFNLDAFSCQSLKKTQKKTAKELLETLSSLDEVKLSCSSLEEKLADREEYFNKRESELQELHRCEIAKADKTQVELQQEHRDKIDSLDRELTRMQESTADKMIAYARESEQKLCHRDAELEDAREREQELLQRIQALSCTENELREKVHSSELEYSERLHLANIKERELTEKINQLQKQVDGAQIRADSEKRELEEKLNLSQDELSIIRQTRSTSTSSNGVETFHNKSINMSQSMILQDEVESLRCVLELKQRDISDLRKQNQELQRASDHTIAAQIKCSALESRVEDLQVQLCAKHEEEKDLIQKIKQLQDQHDNVNKKSSRLSLHNEELQWRLKQNCEKYSATIQELSKSYHEQTSFMGNRSNASYQDLDVTGKSLSECLEGDDDYDGAQVTGSPPSSPIIKGVVEKSDSVSWVLEIDDETPEAVANRMVRRAGSFRTDKCSPSPVPKRQKCQNNTSIQQSASATSISRQTSEPSPQKTAANIRLRSKSVSTKSTPEPPKKMVRSNSNNNPGKVNSEWKAQQITTSSPHVKKLQKSECVTDDELVLLDDEDIGKEEFFLEQAAAASSLNDDEITFSRSRASTFNTGKTYEEFHRDKAPHFKKCRENRGLITCDTAALTGCGELKQLRRPKVAAGEAMISGSEDEGDSSRSSSSTSSAVSTSPSSPSISSNSSVHHHHNHHHQQLEDTMMMKKLVASLNGSGGGGIGANNTPMEVSWSEDGEPSESVV